MDKEEKGTILVVEDDPDFARVLENRLTREGYRCRGARWIGSLDESQIGKKNKASGAGSGLGLSICYDIL